ncbi:gamma-glutamyl-gamma-aminobutyrate hydrolase family protein [Clostridium sp.]|jgi:putative glutamine amidotransferase|uniref:gamma-glutamyl-gamma-aminobutyrate hydrolase family protein n=1 Tax=Clostridium sp. TaxID=1506 RepID=UPI002587FD41|nr:gamma-glutamyl-gamma-aminobutyrate hydrolase family protein [Clostridium sp.]MDF2505341.1 ntpR [Clostridium sp.]
MSRKPIIGISGNFIIDRGGMFPGYKRAYVNDDYVRAVAMAGGIPYIIPIVSDESIVIEQMSNVDALILSGGYDVNPLIYGEEPRQKLGAILPERDKFDIWLLEEACKMNKPVLGICRGIQIMNAAFGGSINQDLSYDENCYIKHFQETSPSTAGHTVEILEGSKLHSILGSKITTNSFHHQTLNRIAEGFTVTAKAKDGTVEAIEKDGENFVLGIQWHPEMMSSSSQEMLHIFRNLVKNAKKW